MRDSQTWIRLLSFTLAIAVHAAVLFGSGFVSQPPAVGTGESGFSVELVEGPPGGEAITAVPKSPPPHDRTIPEPAVPNNAAESPPTEEMVLPNPDATPLPPPPLNENPKPDLVNTNLIASAGSPMEHPGASGLDGGGIGHGTGSGIGGGAGWVNPRYSSNPPPIYPLEARRTGQQGTVVLSVLVNAQGAVETLAVKESSGHVLLDQAAFRAVRYWHFKPATVAGIAVSSHVEQPVTFRLVQ